MSSKHQFALLKTRRFLPLFLTQFLGAFNDNFFKSALVMLITFRLADDAGLDPRILVNVAAGVFILPFFLFSAPASDLADRYDRSYLMRLVKLAEIAIMGAAAAGFQMQNLWVLLVVLFLMGAQSTFFSPAKFSILPQHLEEDELIAGNGLIQTGTYLAILTGTIFGGLLILAPGGLHWVGAGVVAIAAAGWWASPLVADVYPYRDVFWAVIGISWFWLVGATFLAQFPTYAKLILGANEHVATLFLAIFSMGIGLGSMACNALLKGEVSVRYVPAAAVGMSVASTLLWLASRRPPLPPDFPVIGIGTFLLSPANLAILACLFAISFCGGLYIVPLYAAIQNLTSEDRMAGVIACTNVTDSFFMVLSAVGSSLLLAAGLQIPQIFLVMAALTVLAAFLIRRGVRRYGGGRDA
ncbi:MFS transporter [Fretibacterium sp. OH1220_COT-178]|uniref:MFS transporter n=1 Tax=Fretibacterium sp. OH1220_COT-178 TaxID=2491047 RepID=UPI0013159E74|nr:MFS transporter [Fretibacterium sp. OH1220_COT-178]